MNRLVFFMLFLLVSCGTPRNVAVSVPGQLWGKTYRGYVFHDDFYYFDDKTKTEPLIRKPDHYGSVIEYDFKDTVMDILSEGKRQNR